MNVKKLQGGKTESPFNRILDRDVRLQSLGLASAPLEYSSLHPTHRPQTITHEVLVRNRRTALDGLDGLGRWNSIPLSAAQSL